MDNVEILINTLSYLVKFFAHKENTHITLVLLKQFTNYITNQSASCFTLTFDLFVVKAHIDRLGPL